MTSEWFIDDALANLDPADQRRFAAELHAFLHRARRALEAARCGIRVAPLYRLPFSEHLAYEAERREVIGDSTSAAWFALEESTDLAVQVAAIGRCSGVS